MERKEPRCCKQCGFHIIPTDLFWRRGPQERGFCGQGCEEVYEALNDQLRHDAEKDLAKGAL